ncbi:hypothetical protein HIM_04860 [Hirsutella minnesotensis 3608]|uniref:CHCH domain-containing protein n=1 Tax=Hirsutella minnesotensis 3608 TaxID=1043627 RepID=A0A0F7ZUZ1_9HYPO|nr:hypothetical protein HIM_04860 [Hirsutella minnesotensis 3608]
MPRQRSAARPTAARSAPAPQQQRPATTMAAPPQAAQPHAPQQMAPAPMQSQGPGLFGQMASTAAGVAIGSSVGHAIGGLFSGGSSTPEAAPQQAAPAQNTQQQFSGNCQGAAMEFNKCMNEQNGNMQICNWYLEQLKACQAAASPY